MPLFESEAKRFSNSAPKVESCRRGSETSQRSDIPDVASGKNQSFFVRSSSQRKGPGWRTRGQAAGGSAGGHEAGAGRATSAPPARPGALPPVQAFHFAKTMESDGLSSCRHPSTMSGTSAEMAAARPRTPRDSKLCEVFRNLNPISSFRKASSLDTPKQTNKREVAKGLKMRG